MIDLRFGKDQLVPYRLGYFTFPVAGDFDGDGQIEIVARGCTMDAYKLDSGRHQVCISKIISWDKKVPIVTEPMRVMEHWLFSDVTKSKDGKNWIIGVERAEVLIFDGSLDGEGQIRIPLGFSIWDYVGKQWPSVFCMIEGTLENPGSFLLGAGYEGEPPDMEPFDIGDGSFQALYRNEVGEDGKWKGLEYGSLLYLMRRDTEKDTIAYLPPEPLLDSDGNHISGNNPRVVDYDGDGDKDIICIRGQGKIGYIENTGPADNPSWENRGEVKLSSDLPPVAATGIPQIFPVDWYGKKGLILGVMGGGILYTRFRRMGKDGLPQFTKCERIKQYGGRTGITNVFTTPITCDLDGDGNLEILTGMESGLVAWLKPHPSGQKCRFCAPEFLKTSRGPIRHWPDEDGRLSIQGPGEKEWGYTGVTVGDWLGNGLLDLLISTSMGEFIIYPNVGTPNSPRFEEGHWLSQGGKRFQTVWRQRPWLIDFDEDGICELVALDTYGHLRIYRKITDFEIDEGEIVPDKKGKPIKLDFRHRGRHGSCGSGRTRLQVIDINGDGRYDLLIGTKTVWNDQHRGISVSPGPDETVDYSDPAQQRFGSARILRNAGTNQKPVMEDGGYITINGCPVVLSNHHGTPVLCDLDGDGKLELLYGSDAGGIDAVDHDEFSWEKW